LLAEDVLYSNALGLKTSPQCLPCLAKGLEQNQAELKSTLLQHIRRRPCLCKAFELSNGGLPTELDCDFTPPENQPISSTNSPLIPDLIWDAGDLGCGDLVLLLRGKLRAMLPGKLLKVTALDPGAPEDIPAWCKMTGNRLVSQQHPLYFIRNKD
jgi:tRNA 2-thiouridine synthesizing protein A